MKKLNKLLMMAGVASIIASCGQNNEKVLMQSDYPTPPVAAVKPQTFTEFGNQRIDNYYWLKDKTNPEVIAYLNAENAYTDTVMNAVMPLRDKIYNEIIGMIKETDESYPTLMDGFYYYNRTESGKQYRIYCRKSGSVDAKEEILFDANIMADGKKAFLFNGYEVSTNNNLALYLYNETGSYAESTLKVKDLTTGKDLDISIDGIANAVWANDNKTIFYTKIDKALRPYQVYRHELGSKKPDVLVYEEKDARFNLYVDKSKTKKNIFFVSSSSTTTEYRFLSADKPTEKEKIFMPRVQDVEYFVVETTDRFFIRYKDKENLNGKIYETPLTGFEDKKTWKEVIPHDPAVRLEGIDVLNGYLITEVRKNGLNEINILSLADGKKSTIPFQEPVYTIGLIGNPEIGATTIRYSYISLNRPNTLYEYDLTTDESKKLKEQEIPSGFNPDNYVVERLWADAPDGVKVPMAVVYKKGMKKNGNNPALIYSYGSYGSSSDVFFSPVFYSLIDRGYVFAIAQIRGGSDLGEQWYEDGKLLKKINTFTDFIACTEKLINDKYSCAEKMSAMGGSAGGLLMGAIVNMRPELYNSIVAAVPFVDVINTMLDTSLPLTTQEYEEWGNPNVEEYYRYMLSYSPYDNIKAQNYPNMLVTAGLNDSQVGFHEPAKFVAKLRATKTDNNIILLKTNMDSGHGGATGRYDSYKEYAFELAFIMSRIGITK